MLPLASKFDLYAYNGVIHQCDALRPVFSELQSKDVHFILHEPGSIEDGAADVVWCIFYLFVLGTI